MATDEMAGTGCEPPTNGATPTSSSTDTRRSRSRPSAEAYSPDSPVFRSRVEIARIPPCYRRAKLDDLVTENTWEKLMIDGCRQWLADQQYLKRGNAANWVYIYGGPGTGKTYAVCALAVECIRRRVWPVRFWPVPELFRAIAEGFRRDEAAAREAFDLAVACEVLVLDDIGAERDSAWTGEQLYLLLNHRDGAGLPTLITSSGSLSDLAIRFSERAASRIAGRVKPPREVIGRDRRKDGAT